MLILHAVWAPAEADLSGELHLWGETAQDVAWRPTATLRGVPLHPCGAAPSDLRDALTARGLHAATPGTLLLHLPACPPARPEESDGLRLVSGRVATLRPPVGPAVVWLADRTRDGSVGGDLAYWARVSAFALELLRGEQVAPALDRRADGDLQASWRPVLTGAAERRTVRALTEAMPPACRTPAIDPAAARRSSGSGSATPVELLHGFLTAAVDALARAWLAEAGWPEARWLAARDARRMPPGAARWLEALAATRPGAARLASRRAGDIARAVAAWSGPIVSPGPPFRLALRLTPPVSGFARSEADWRLDFFLQATDDADVLVPAAAIWQTTGAVARVAGRRVVEPQERLLADLAQTARLVPAVAASLERVRPEGADLTVDQAYAFLRDVIPVLAEAGIAVLAPPWWTRQGTRRRLGVRVRLSPSADGARRGRFGLEAVVAYDWQVALGDRLLTHAEFARLVAAQAPLVQIGGDWVELDPAQLARALRFWQRGRTLTVAEAMRLAASGGPEGMPVVQVAADGWLAEALADDGTPRELPEPVGFVGQLRPYQRRGLGWLRFMRQHGLGACLADDMGLGKTIQLIASLLADRADGRTGPTLVICPTSVLGNWRHELARFGPDLRVLVHHGPERTDAAGLAVAAAAHDVVLTTYALLPRDEAAMASVSWAGLVLDEAQNVKNSAAQASRVARSLRSGFRVALTGTPIENRLGELWSLMEVLNPGFLGTAEAFRRRFTLPIERDRDQTRADELRRLVAPFVLRRLKSDPAIAPDLPEKLEMKDYPPLTREQAALYESVVQEMLARVEASEGVERRGLILATLTKLKQVCNHPAQARGEDGPLGDRSGKLARLEEMLEESIAAGDQTLVFTQFAELGGRLQRHLHERLGHEVLYLYGGTPAEERDRLVAKFQAPDGPPVFVLSLRAGGTGLNLTRANRVIHYDRWWNPAVEAQATDRAYRIGQTRDVQVHAFICAGTLEERIDELIESKRALAETVIGTGEAWLTELSTEELRSVVELRRAVIVDA